MDPKLDSDARQSDHGLYSDDFNHRPCDAPDPDCLCDRCLERDLERELKLMERLSEDPAAG